jgi:hypothetical protein
VPYEEKTRHGTTYRIVSEETNISHPEGVKAIVIAVPRPKDILWEKTGAPGDMAAILEDARRYVERL